jgi:hypothetical protein
MILENFNEFSNKFCVYVFLDPRKHGKYEYGDGDFNFDYEPIYVGKGTNNRPKRHLFLYKNYNTRFYQKLKSISNKGYEIIFKVIKDNLTEYEAFREEVRVLSIIKRIESGGPLLNLTDGGEGQSGYKHTEESKKKISNSIRNNVEWQNYMKSEEFSKKVSKGLMGHVGYGKGIPRSQEVRDKIKDSLKGKYWHKPHSDESKRKMSIKRQGIKNPNSKRYVIKISGEIHTFEGKVQLRQFINDYNRINELPLVKRINIDILLKDGKSKNFELVSEEFLNRKSRNNV